MQIQPKSFAFTLLLGFLAAVPYSGIDINLPALAATGASLDRSASDVGQTMSAFMVSLAAAPLLYGPVSDRFGRKPVLMFGLALFIVASLTCATAQSLPELLIFRFVQGIGAASTGMTFAVIRDLFDETTARAKIANVMVAINVVTIIAPTAGAALLTLGNWRLIYAVQTAIGIALLWAVLLGFGESAKIDPGIDPRIDPVNRLAPGSVIRCYRRVLTHRVSFSYILVGAACGATLFAYVTGSSLFFIDAVGLTASEYGLIFSACSAAVMSGALLDGRLGRRGVQPAQVVTIGLVLSAVAAWTLLAMALAEWTPLTLVTALLMTVALSFGMTIPNILNATMQPMPDIAGAVGAAAGSVQMIAGAASSSLVAALFDGQSALSMATVMATSSLLALTAYWLLARPAGRHGSFAGELETRSASRVTSSVTNPN
jgi:DHA1 family bicyclomycin/chloramphenicol resistance-like MFS transporter